LSGSFAFSFFGLAAYVWPFECDYFGFWYQVLCSVALPDCDNGNQFGFDPPENGSLVAFVVRGYVGDGHQVKVCECNLSHFGNSPNSV
jgi:hypothetical protein